MNNNSVVIMAGGSSSRMKRSLNQAQLPLGVLEAAKKLHKSLIPLGEAQKPLLYYLLKNCVSAGIKTAYLITSEENEPFFKFAEVVKKETDFQNFTLEFAIQKIPPNREKPLGTADALLHCLEQHPNLLKERFTVCNGDNLYAVADFKLLAKNRKPPHALIAYDAQGLGYTEERISKFALLDFDSNHHLHEILEKPDAITLTNYKSKHHKIWVSMNIFNFYGEAIFPYLENCPLDPDRQEKELPKAVGNLIKATPQAVKCYPRKQRIPDLTSAEDIETFFT